MITSDNPEILINQIEEGKTSAFHPKMVEILSKHNVSVMEDPSTGLLTARGIDKRLQSMKSSGKRKSRTREEELTPPGRITGITLKAQFDTIQALLLTDKPHKNSPKMRWLFYWMLVCLPQERIYTETWQKLLELYYYDEPEIVPILRGVFLILMTRIEDIQKLVSCGHFPPYSFSPVPLLEVSTVCLGRITDIQEKVRDTEDTKQRKEYLSGFYPYTIKYQTGSINSHQYSTVICSMVEKGGIHALFEKIVEEQTEIAKRDQSIEDTLDISKFSMPSGDGPFGFSEFENQFGFDNNESTTGEEFSKGVNPLIPGLPSLRYKDDNVEMKEQEE